MYITLIFIVITLIHAYLDYRRIEIEKKELSSQHKFERTSWYFIICFAFLAWFDSIQMNTVEENSLYFCYGVLINILTRAAIFSFALNLMRNKELMYVSKTTSSKIDQFFMKNKINPRIIGLLALVVLLMLTIYNIVNNIQ